MSRILVVVYFLLPGYWAYLVFSTQPLVIYDAVSYENFGRLLHEQGLMAYFQSLRREPLFPLLISWAMGISGNGTVPYTVYLKFLMLGFLAATMVGTYRITRMMGAGRNAAGLAALYVGISPALLNSTLWLWSEAAAYPWVVWIIFVAARLWRAIRAERPLGGIAAVLAVLFFLLTMVKAIAATVLVIFLVPFYVIFLNCLFRRQWGRLWRVAVSTCIVLVLMGAAVYGYKWLNWRYNRSYTITDRWDYAFYGNTVRRFQPMTRERVAQALLSVPRLGLCERVYGKECLFWTYVESDNIFARAQQKLAAAGFSDEQKTHFFVSSSFQLMVDHPFRQLFFMSVEASKMLFWENRLYFVNYPPWLAKVYSQKVVVYALCFGWALLSLTGMVCAIFYLFKRFLGQDQPCGEARFATRLFAVWFIVCFSGLYSLFFIDIRYAFPIAPLFVALLVACLSGPRVANVR